MKSLVLSLLLLFGVALRAQTPATPVSDKVANPGSPPAGVQPPENSVLKDALLLTEWKTVRNPFRFEIAEARTIATDRFEHMEVTGFMRLPHENGGPRTYAFVCKTVQQSEPVPDPKAGEGKEKVLTETLVMESYPEILDEVTTPTDEQIEQSSIILANEQLWFIGILTTTNHQHAAVFWPYGPYPVKEESLRQFEIADALKDMPIRVTKFGEKIGGRGGRVPLLAKPRKTPEATDAVKSPTAEPTSKSTNPIANATDTVDSQAEPGQVPQTKSIVPAPTSNSVAPPAFSTGAVLPRLDSSISGR